MVKITDKRQGAKLIDLDDIKDGSVFHAKESDQYLLKAGDLLVDISDGYVYDNIKSWAGKYQVLNVELIIK